MARGPSHKAGSFARSGAQGRSHKEEGWMVRTKRRDGSFARRGSAGSKPPASAFPNTPARFSAPVPKRLRSARDRFSAERARKAHCARTRRRIGRNERESARTQQRGGGGGGCREGRTFAEEDDLEGVLVPALRSRHFEESGGERARARSERKRRSAHTREERESAHEERARGARACDAAAQRARRGAAMRTESSACVD